MRALYTVLLRLALPFILLRLWWRGRSEAGYRSGVTERFGFYTGDAPERLIWLHAVSVGEARAAEPLVRALLARFPEHRLLVTCTTAAGRETLAQVYAEAVLAAYLPYDYPEPVSAFLAHFKPRLGVLMETEVWPNLLHECRRRSIPVLLANARLSEKSAAGYRRLHALAAPAFASLAAVCAQSRDDAGRLAALGARDIEVTGNLKFDVTPDAAQLAAGREWHRALGRPVLLLASTREGEEAMLLDAQPAAGEHLVVVVPRHPRRFDEVAPLAHARRSAQAAPGPTAKVYLGDTMGEMAFYYAACDVAVIGGSLAPLGGQNLIEALAAGAPVVLGPHMFNFAEATRLAVQAGAAVQEADAAGVMRAALALLGNPARREAMSVAGKALCEAHRGATARHLAVCERLLRR